MNLTTKLNDPKVLREIGFEMRILFVEDDLDIQQHIKSFLLHFFSRVDTAENGEDALELYNKYPYDLVITDLTMPIMGGLELSSTIRSTNVEQKIIVVSGHSESEKLIELINIGVDGFILKPIDMESILQILIKTCQAIYDHKMIHYFNNLLEQTNNELKKSNIELECTLNKLQLMRDDYSEEKLSEGIPDLLSLNEFYSPNNAFDLDRTNEDLEQIEDDFNLFLVSSDRNTTTNLLIGLNHLLRQYAHEINLIPPFQALAYKLIDLTNLLDETDNDLEEMSFLLADITSLFDQLEQWRKGIFVYRNVDDLHFMDDYLIKKIIEIEIAIQNFKGVES